MILELSKRLEKNNRAFDQINVKSSYSQKETAVQGIHLKYIIIFLIHLILCLGGVLYGITLTTFNIIEKEIYETERTILYELGNTKI